MMVTLLYYFVIILLPTSYILTATITSCYSLSLVIDLLLYNELFGMRVNNISIHTSVQSGFHSDKLSCSNCIIKLLSLYRDVERLFKSRIALENADSATWHALLGDCNIS